MWLVVGSSPQKAINVNEAQGIGRMPPDPLLSDWFSWFGGTSFTTTSTSVSIPWRLIATKSGTNLSLCFLLHSYNKFSLAVNDWFSWSGYPYNLFVLFQLYSVIIDITMYIKYDLFAYQLSRVYKPLLVCFCNFLYKKSSFYLYNFWLCTIEEPL